MDRGADIHARRGYTGWTPLHMAASFNPEPAVVSLLLERGSDIHSIDDLGRTPVQSAAFHNREPAIMELLLDRARTSMSKKKQD